MSNQHQPAQKPPTQIKPKPPRVEPDASTRDTERNPRAPQAGQSGQKEKRDPNARDPLHSSSGR
jgi:hypothetical protein